MKPAVVKQNVGNDISKDKFNVCFSQLVAGKETATIRGTRKFNNSLAGFKAFTKWVEGKRDKTLEVRIVVEATGVYHEQFAYYIHEQTDYRLSVILPNKSKAYAKSLNLKTKTDRADAKMLGQMGLERSLEKWLPISEDTRQLKALSRERIRLLNQKTSLQNQQHALKSSYQPNSKTLTRLKRLITAVKKLITQVEKEIKQVVKQDAFLKERIANVCTIKGIGLVTAATLIAETDGFVLFTSRSQLVSYCGYDVVERESGKSIRGKTRISKRGNKYIRRALFFPAMTAVKHVESLQQLYLRVFGRTKIKMKGYVAVQRKLLLLVYTLFKKNEPFNPNYEQVTDVAVATLVTTLEKTENGQFLEIVE